jgi:hypothetical protein
MEQPDVAAVKEVETAVGEDHLLALPSEPCPDGDKFVERIHFPGFFSHSTYPGGGLMPISGEKFQP